MISVCACTSTRFQAQDANAQLKRVGWKPGLGVTVGPLWRMARRSRISWEQGFPVSQKSGLGSCSKTSSKEILIDLIWQLILNTLTSLWILLRKSPMNMCLGTCEHRQRCGIGLEHVVRANWRRKIHLVDIFFSQVLNNNSQRNFVCPRTFWKASAKEDPSSLRCKRTCQWCTWAQWSQLVVTNPYFAMNIVFLSVTFAQTVIMLRLRWLLLVQPRLGLRGSGEFGTSSTS